MKKLLIPCLLAMALAACNNSNKKLPILGERETKTVKGTDGKDRVDTVYKTIPPFSFLNQDSVAFTDKDLNGKVYVADFFFTSCQSICPIMHKNMLKAFDKYKDNPDVMFLSHSIDTKYDTPSVLKKYAQKLGVYGKKWEFVHGSRDSIYTIGEKNYLVAIQEDKKAQGGYIHQGWLVLVDKDKRLRGAYDGTNEEQVAQMLKDMDVLLNEYKK